MGFWHSKFYCTEIKKLDQLMVKHEPDRLVIKAGGEQSVNKLVLHIELSEYTQVIYGPVELFLRIFLVYLFDKCFCLFRV